MTERGRASAKRILLVEDSPGECELIAHALAEQGFGDWLQVEQSIESAWALLRERGTALPHLVLLDLKLRNSNGLLLLRRLRDDARLCALPVVILTSSDDPHDIAASYATGANGYVVKPGTFSELLTLTGDLCRFWLQWNRLPVQEPTPAC